MGFVVVGVGVVLARGWLIGMLGYLGFFFLACCGMVVVAVVVGVGVMLARGWSIGVLGDLFFFFFICYGLVVVVVMIDARGGCGWCYRCFLDSEIYYFIVIFILFYYVES